MVPTGAYHSQLLGHTDCNNSIVWRNLAHFIINIVRDLGHNAITNVPVGAFSGLSALQTLYIH